MKRVFLAFVLVVLSASFAFGEPSGKVMMYSSTRRN